MSKSPGMIILWYSPQYSVVLGAFDLRGKENLSWCLFNNVGTFNVTICTQNFLIS